MSLLLQCVADRLLPDVPVASARLLRSAGCEVVIPSGQHCCGLPAIDGGDEEAARRMAKQTITALERTADGVDVVVPAPSCALAIRDDYERLFADEPQWRERALALKARTYDLVSYLSGPARLPNRCLAAGQGSLGSVAVDRFCQGENMMKRGSAVEDLVEALTGERVLTLPEADVCCGFGGSTSITAPGLSAEVLRRKLENVAACGADVLLTDNPGCLLHLRGGADAAGSPVNVMHVAEYLALRSPRR